MCGGSTERASATALVLADMPTGGSGIDRAQAAQAAGLLLARADAGILTAAEITPVARTVETALGADTLADLRAIWRAAQRVADDDTEAMLELGHRWCTAVGADPGTPPDTPDTSVTPPGSRLEGPAGASELTAAISEVLRRVATAVEAAALPADPAETAATARATEDAARAAAESTARAVFTAAPATRPGRRRVGRTALAGTRPATDGERAAARQLGRALTTAAVRDRATITTTSATPPGRLRMRGALAADAQCAAGAMPTAEPFIRTTRKVTPAPPLRLGIACDVSGSMYEFAAPVASAAWILAHAAHHTRVTATTATVIFGNYVRPIARPGDRPAVVTEFATDDDYEDIPAAIDALDGALDLSRPGAARLLVIVSDGLYTAAARDDGQTRITRLRRHGCAVLWLTPPGTSRPLDGVTVHPLTDPAATGQTIGRAATAALRATR
ncbi:hypothetical protein [Pseudonocardia nigra]|uniref:hypothetical protein n=1 Tax=Pseudonocardia nigra TaxID=1921578 RepID=UPI001C5D27DC|nr:hypothetical protein [Pseudonocardia nigra]